MDKNAFLDRAKHITRTELAAIFNITEQSVGNWVKSGCPRAKNKTFDLPSVISWREKKLTERAVVTDRAELEVERLRNQVEKLSLEIEDKKRLTISREKFEEIQRNQATELMDFVKGGFKRNSLTIISKLGLRAGKLLKFNEVMDGFMKAMFDAFIEGGKDID